MHTAKPRNLSSPPNDAGTYAVPTSVSRSRWKIGPIRRAGLCDYPHVCGRRQQYSHSPAWLSGACKLKGESARPRFLSHILFGYCLDILHCLRISRSTLYFTNLGQYHACIKGTRLDCSRHYSNWRNRIRLCSKRKHMGESLDNEHADGNSDVIARDDDKRSEHAESAAGPNQLRNRQYVEQCTRYVR
jgi:hypothetical protein